MAKTQTFGDKLKKKKVDDFINVRVIQGLQSELRGTVRFIERMIKVKDLNELDKVDINK
ncbi:hypothetical protein ACFLSQ_02160 [Bacteroidota bacterium]